MISFIYLRWTCDEALIVFGGLTCAHFEAEGMGTLFPLLKSAGTHGNGVSVVNKKAVLFGLKFTDIIYYKFKSSQASNAMLQSSKHSSTKRNLMQMTIQGHARSRVLESVER